MVAAPDRLRYGLEKTAMASSVTDRPSEAAEKNV
jgi:hypothetical protein